MSDIEELDTERLNELESLLYSAIHYNDEQEFPNPTAMDTQSPISSTPEEQQVKRIVSNTRVVNNNTKAAKPRYWEENIAATITAPTITTNTDKPNAQLDKSNTDLSVGPVSRTVNNVSDENMVKSMPPPAAKPPIVHTKNKHPAPKAAGTNVLKKDAANCTKSLPKQPKKKQQEQAQNHIPKPDPKPMQIKRDSPERFDQKLLVAIPQGSPPQHTQRKPINKGPFVKESRKLEQLQRLSQKKEKSKRVRAKKQKQETSVEIIDLASSDKTSEDDDDDDEVIHVPMPSPPIIDVDASEEETAAETTYLGENAIDSADVKLGLTCETNTEPMAITPPLHSPCSSVLSADDFIVQKDTSRLLADRARVTDEDLMVLTENAISMHNTDSTNNAENAELPNDNDDAEADSSSEQEFVPPSRLEKIKQNFRVNEQQFRALDVYESESDLTEGGIYSKTKQKPTIIRNIDTASESSDVEELAAKNTNKSKRFRKRLSSTNQSHSEPNNGNIDDETDSENDVQSTGVPGIARGPAIERCKRKIRRISARRNSESAVSWQAQKLRKNQVDDIDEASSESLDEPLPSAREIAEKLLEQEKVPLPMQLPKSEVNEQCETISIGSDANTDDEEEIQDAMTERLSAVFERIDSDARKARQLMEKRESVVQIVNDSQDESQHSVEEILANTQEVENVLKEAQQAENAENPEVSVTNNSLQLGENINMELKDKPQIRSGDLIGWNDEMSRFYNDSWHGEQFTVKRIQKSMNPQRQYWKINNEDRFPVMRQRAKGKCTNCYEMGHLRYRCPLPRKPLVCNACGINGHTEPRCPNAICLGCGSKQSLYVQKCTKCSFHSRLVCQLCKMRGHSTDYCPDKWRRYHSTTRANNVLDSSVTYKAKHCSYCAGRGHLFENCRQRMGEFRNTNFTSTIISHQKVYRDRSGPINYMDDTKSFHSLDETVHFKWSTETPKNSYYARFLKEVGLGHVLRSKRKSTEALLAVQQNKLHRNEYIPNPLAIAASKSLTGPSTVTETLNILTENLTNASTTSSEIQQEEITSNFPSMSEKVDKKPQKSTKRSAKATITANNEPSVAPHELDSDSNYSFSDHFEMPTSTTNECNASTTAPPKNKLGPMDDLPDIIPLSQDYDDDQTITSNSQANNTSGISMWVNSQFAARNTNNESEESSSLPEIPSEATILMARDQTEYLFSPEGREFLKNAAKQCKVDVRMDFKEYGYVLVIYGLKKYQEDLQLMLLRRNQEVKRKSIEFQSQRPPKRVDVLIRFMRDGINSLNGNLGNANTLLERIKKQEEINTKIGFKTAERLRRLLNMILLGQGGLQNGNMHLDHLLLILKKLLSDCSPDENVSKEMRNDIEEHWRMIFTSYPHNDYDSMLQSYNKLVLKNRLPQLNIDPVLLGLPSTRKQPLPNKPTSNLPPPPPPPVWTVEPATLTMQQQQNNTNKIRSPAAARSFKQRPQPQAKSQAPQQNQSSNLARRAQAFAQAPPFNNPLQRARNNLKLSAQFNSERDQINPECARVLKAMSDMDSRSTVNTDANKPSMFWSRESLKYLDDLIKMTLNPEMLERLHRVLQRSQRGQLSHNDYRDVIRLHSILQSK